MTVEEKRRELFPVRLTRYTSEQEMWMAVWPSGAYDSTHPPAFPFFFFILLLLKFWSARPLLRVEGTRSSESTRNENNL